MPELKVNDETKYQWTERIIIRHSLKTADEDYREVITGEAICRPHDRIDLARGRRLAFTRVVQDLRKHHPTEFDDDLTLESRERSKSNRRKLWEQFLAWEKRQERERLMRIWNEARHEFPKRFDWNKFYALMTGEKPKKRKQARQVRHQCAAPILAGTKFVLCTLQLGHKGTHECEQLLKDALPSPPSEGGSNTKELEAGG